MSRISPEWEEVESAWLDSANENAVDSLGALRVVASRHRRQRAGALLESIVALALIALAVIAVREHPGRGIWIWGAVLVAHAAGIWWVARRSRDVAQRVLVQPTATFLAAWRSACRQQLTAVRIGLGILTFESLFLAVALVRALSGATFGSLRILPSERVWVASLIAVLGVAAWLVLVRSRMLVELERASRMQRDLEADAE